MWLVVLEFLEALLSKATFGWLQRRKTDNAQEAQNDVASLSDAEVIERMRRWTRKP